MHVDLNHVITNGMVTYPGLPTPETVPHLTREAAEEVYGPGVTFEIGMVSICTNTGTYLDVPYHRFADGHDLSELALDRIVAVPAVVFDRTGPDIELTDADLEGLAGHAVLVRTGHDVHFDTPDYLVDHPWMSAATAEALVAADVACVGIDSLNIDSTADGRRPVHTALLGAGIPIVEHLTNLGELPHRGFTFTAVPPRMENVGTFTVRAFATLP